MEFFQLNTKKLDHRALLEDSDLAELRSLAKPINKLEPRLSEARELRSLAKPINSLLRFGKANKLNFIF